MGAAGRMRPHGRIMVEFGDGQAPAIEAIFRNGGWIVEAVEADLAGRLRILIARLIEG
jgi:methylase of polypeptide subunit release factors